MRRPQRSSEIRQLVLLGQEHEYNLKRSKARSTLALMINRQGLIVHAPWALPLLHIEQYLQLKAGWIFEKLANYGQHIPAAASWVDGMLLWYLGEPITLRVSAQVQRMALVENVLYVPELSETLLKNAVLTWYKKSALAYFNQRLIRFAGGLPRQPSHLKLSNARTRWGSCTRDGVVRLNWRLIQASDAEIDYVLAHELAHLSHMNHSARFWNELHRIYPGYQAPHKLLRLQGHRYHQVA